MTGRNDVIKKQLTGSSDEEGLRTLFDRYFDRLSYFAFGLVRDRDAADDIAQEAFIKYWQSRSSIGKEEAFIRNFLYTTVKNACLNSLRHDRIVAEYAAGFASEERTEEAVIESIISAEVLHSLHQALSSLPEAYRRIGQLAFLDGKKNQEIADELEMSVNTVKKQKQKVLELLRLRLAPEMMMLLLILYV